MKKKFLLMLALLGNALALNANLKITNRTSFRAQVFANWSTWFCKDDHDIDLKPGETASISHLESSDDSSCHVARICPVS